MNAAKLVLICTGSLLLLVALGLAKGSLASAPDGLPHQAQDLDFNRLFTAPDGTNVSDTQVWSDLSGGLHLAYSAYSSNPEGHYPAYYAYCPANCDDSDNWTLVEVGELYFLGDSTRLALAPNGQPRLMWVSQQVEAVNSDLQYAECNANCTDKASWTILTVAESSASTPASDHYFAVDKLGRPRFVYTDLVDGHTGTFYAYCDSACTDLANWYETSLFTVTTNHFSLTFSSSNQPRLAFIYTPNTESDIGYAECNANCGSGSNWDNVLTFVVGSDKALRLQLDSNDRPRLAFYSGYIQAGDPNNDLLFYSWCNTNCLASENWVGFSVGLLDNYGQMVDLVLDAQDHPHLASYADDQPYGLVYSLCTADCESQSGSWEHYWVEDSNELNAISPVPPVPGCNLSSWYPGEKPSITLRGNLPVISYDAEHLQGGTCSVHTDILISRIAVSYEVNDATETPTATTTSGPIATATHTPTPTGTANPAFTPTPTVDPTLTQHAFLPMVTR